MYRIIDEHHTKAEAHFLLYEEAFKNTVVAFLEQVPRDSYAKVFLKEIAANKNELIHLLLSGDFGQQKGLIASIDANLSAWERKKTGEKKRFIASMKVLFVDGMYDNDDFFSKNDHVKRVDIEICPYCGRNYVYYAEHPTKTNPHTMVKPDIDHFLPKNEYPYLAMNYYNLIPSCISCNRVPCKWTNDPIGATRDKEYLMHPYEFREGDISFSYKPTVRLYDKDSIEVRMNCQTSDLDTGYKTWLNLDQFYVKHNGIVKNMYVRLESLQRSYQRFMGDNFSIPKSFIDHLPEIVFGYKLEPDKAKEELMYKFKKDIYLQMRKQMYRI